MIVINLSFPGKALPILLRAKSYFYTGMLSKALRAAIHEAVQRVVKMAGHEILLAWERMYHTMRALEPPSEIKLHIKTKSGGWRKVSIKLYSKWPLKKLKRELEAVLKREVSLWEAVVFAAYVVGDRLPQPLDSLVYEAVNYCRQAGDVYDLRCVRSQLELRRPVVAKMPKELQEYWTYLIAWPQVAIYHYFLYRLDVQRETQAERVKRAQVAQEVKKPEFKAPAKAAIKSAPLYEKLLQFYESIRFKPLPEAIAQAEEFFTKHQGLEQLALTPEDREALKQLRETPGAARVTLLKELLGLKDSYGVG